MAGSRAVTSQQQTVTWNCDLQQTLSPPSFFVLGCFRTALETRLGMSSFGRLVETAECGGNDTVLVLSPQLLFWNPNPVLWCPTASSSQPAVSQTSEEDGLCDSHQIAKGKSLEVTERRQSSELGPQCPSLCYHDLSKPVV